MDRREDKGAQEQEHGLKAAVITVSDRSFRGEREDKSGPVLSAILSENGYEITEELLLPDEEDRIAEELVRLCDEKRPDVIFTTGGTGFSNRDRTPEATLRVAKERSGHSRSSEGRKRKIYSQRDAQPRGERDPGENHHHKSPRKPQSRKGRP